MQAVGVSDIAISPLTVAESDLNALRVHYQRHRREHDAGPAFMPFAPEDRGPNSPDAAVLDYALNRPGWLRIWVAHTEGMIVGHMDLRGGRLRSELHRATLGLGLEGAYRSMGLGRRLMQTAIGFCRAQDSLEWLDLNVFSHNAAGIALYQRLGFETVGRSVDRFRLGDQSIDDCSMSLNVR